MQIDCNTPLISAIDRYYLLPWSVMLASYREHNPHRPTSAYVLHYDLTDDDLAYIQRIAALTSIPVEAIQIPKYPFVLFQTRKRQSLAARKTMSTVAYAKAAIDKLLPAHLNRVLLIDADVVINGPLDEILDMPLSAPLAATSNIPRLHDCQFNSGVVLVNLAEWRRRGIWAAAERFLFAYSDSLHSHDQHVLNLMFAGEWEKISLKFNYIEDHFRFLDRNKQYSREEVILAREAPAIIHYAVGSDKPWKQKCDHPRADLYRSRVKQLQSLRAGLNIVEPA